ncbi:MAG TPA: FdtA/QdtA family cupin domain-containing protein [Pyrinomonadaceae bacterium]|jgi:hypothetical protein
METGATVSDVKKVVLPQIINAKGNLTFIEQNNHVPFKVKNVSWIYDVPGGEALDGYTVKKSEQFIIALSGNIDVVLNDGSEQREFLLNRSYEGLYIPPMIWRRIENFSTNSLTLVLSSNCDAESEYIRDFESFLSLKKNG